ncbi:hypothetical protein HDU88_008334 [Geranomyces variabilis]|nr:hypothetical protein HDU88_008334 [Geranomyces variabilis]
MAHAATLAAVPSDSHFTGTTRNLDEFPGSWDEALGELGVIVSPMQFLHVPAVIKNRNKPSWPLIVMGLQLLEFGFEYDKEQKYMSRDNLYLYVMEKGLHYVALFTTETPPEDRSGFQLHDTLFII